VSLILAGDIGGTRARFALYETGRTAPRHLHEEVFESRSQRSFEAAIERFLGGLAKRPKLTAATFGIAGPVVDRRVHTTNLPWTIDARAIAKAFKIGEVTLLNDLVAVGLGAIASPPKKLAVIHRGRPAKRGGTLAVIAAGTGLGEAVFVWDGKEHIACATEGSHVEFAPRNELQDELLRELRRRHGHVSYERVASGSTIHPLYDFFVAKKGVREGKAARERVRRAPDPNVAIVELAESGESEAARRAIDLWSSVYGAEAGNLALKSLSTAGVLVCGGVSTSLAGVLAKGLPGKAGKQNAPSPFVEAYLDKGRMRAVVDRIPVAVCLEPRAGLLGAVSHAASCV
jgi:glucokinase